MLEGNEKKYSIFLQIIFIWKDVQKLIFRAIFFIPFLPFIAAENAELSKI